MPNLFQYIRHLRWIFTGKIRIQKQINKWPDRKKLNIIIGSGNSRFENWISTDLPHFDVLKERNWEYFFKHKKPDRILAEHVLEHLTLNEARKLLKLVYKYLNQNGVFRIAVPDEFHPSKYYYDLMKPGGMEPGADDHKVFYNHILFESLGEDAGFKVEKIEYFDKSGFFYTRYQDNENGIIMRSAINYTGLFTDNTDQYKKLLTSIDNQKIRNFLQEKKISYTSLIIDLIKL